MAYAERSKARVAPLLSTASDGRLMRRWMTGGGVEAHISGLELAKQVKAHF